MQIDEILIHSQVTSTPKLQFTRAYLGPMKVVLVHEWLPGRMRTVGAFRGMFTIFPVYLGDDSLLCISH